MKSGSRLFVILALPVALLGALSLLASWWLTRRQAPDRERTPASVGLPHQPVAFLTEDGITLRGWLILAPAPQRGTIIFCHGFSGSMDPDVEYAPAFHAEGYNVLMFDLRGHGRSGGERVSLGYFERLDLLAAITFLQRRGFTPIGLLGFSMGGAVALMTASLCPGIRAVVSDSAYARPETPLVGQLRSRGVPTLVASFAARIVIAFTGLRLGCAFRDARPLDWVSAIAPQGTLIIHGGRDQIVPPSEAEELYQRAGEPKGLWIEPSAGHRESANLTRQEYLTHILDFFNPFFPVSPSGTASGTPQ